MSKLQTKWKENEITSPSFLHINIEFLLLFDDLILIEAY